MIEKMQTQIAWRPLPEICSPAVPVKLTQETMEGRREYILEKMRERGFDALAIYADREHGGNFAYLTGFAPRFEEAILILHQCGEAFLLLGNEMLRMADYSRIPAKAIHVPQLSLPNQPSVGFALDEALRRAGIRKAFHVGIAGWKLLRPRRKEGRCVNFEIPYFIVQAIGEAAGFGCIEPATGLFMDPGQGARSVMNVNEIAHYEYGASLASAGMRRLLDRIEPGMTEMELAGLLESCGQPNTVQTICAAGQRFEDAEVSPRNKVIKKGARLSATVGYPGGLTSRCAYVAEGEEDLPDEERAYVDRVAAPYFRAMVSWYETVGAGVCSGDVYKLMERTVPQAIYGWTLNPGHLTADEEWLSSPFFSWSSIRLKPGMALQMDLIVKVAGFGGCNAEDGVILMDSAMQTEMKHLYPQVWARMEQRKLYMRDILGIILKEDVFPMSDLCGYVRPFLLDKNRAFISKT